MHVSTRGHRSIRAPESLGKRIKDFKLLKGCWNQLQRWHVVSERMLVGKWFPPPFPGCTSCACHTRLKCPKQLSHFSKGINLTRRAMRSLHQKGFSLLLLGSKKMNHFLTHLQWWRKNFRVKKTTWWNVWLDFKKKRCFFFESRNVSFVLEKFGS